MRRKQGVLTAIPLTFFSTVTPLTLTVTVSLVQPSGPAHPFLQTFDVLASWSVSLHTAQRLDVGGLGTAMSIISFLPSVCTGLMWLPRPMLRKNGRPDMPVGLPSASTPGESALIMSAILPSIRLSVQSPLPRSFHALVTVPAALSSVTWGCHVRLFSLVESSKYSS